MGLDGLCPTKGHFAMSGDIRDCHICVPLVPGEQSSAVLLNILHNHQNEGLSGSKLQ